MIEPLRTYITVDQEIAQRDRHGFAPCCCYGRNLKLEAPNEIGAIVKIKPGSARYDTGMFVQDCEVLERIFVI